MSDEPSSGDANGTATARPVRADARRNMEAILDAAREELIADPRAGLARIAERAGVHRATLHRHFSTREDLISACYRAYLEEVAQALHPDLEADPMVELERFTRQVYATNIRWQAWLWGPMLPPELHEIRWRMAETLEQMLGPAQAAGRVRGDMTLEELRVAWGGPIQLLASMVVARRWSLDEAVDFTMRLLLPPR